jgi:hypothetical protein
MNYIYDVKLNFNEYYKNISFYEWNSNDLFTYIDRIPIYRITDIGMNEVNSSLIKIKETLLEEINNKTNTDNGIIKYSLLITDMNRVIGLKFDSNGLLLEKSSLLIDEEDAVIEEASLLDLDIFEYEVIESYSDNYFLTRNEKYKKNYLFEEINSLYNNGKYDEISYLYYEVFKETKNIHNKYLDLVKFINSDNSIDELFEVVKMTKEKSY